MKNLVVALVAIAFAAPATAAAQDLAPAVKRKPAAPAPPAAPAAPRQEVAAPTSPAAPQPDAATSTGPVPVQPVAAPSTTPAAPRPAARTERDVQAALAAAAQSSGGPALDTGLLKVMGRLVIEGRCSEAASVAAQQGRTALANRAAQLCK